MSQSDKKPDTFSTRRLEALTDGVFAIAMTLLVLNLDVSSFQHIKNSSELLAAFAGESTSIISFIISFLLLGSTWAIHTRQFEYIKRTDRHLTMINTFRLLAVVLIPLTTSISSTYMDVALGKIMLPLNFLILTVISYWQWHYAMKPSAGLYDEVPVEIRKNRIGKYIIYTAILVVFGSVFVGEAAFLLFILTPFIFRLTSPRAAK